MLRILGFGLGLFCALFHSICNAIGIGFIIEVVMIMDKPVAPTCLFITRCALEVVAQARRNSLLRDCPVLIGSAHLYECG